MSLLLRSAFSCLPFPSAAIQELVKACKDAALIHLQSLLKLESTPFTQNGHYLSEKTAKRAAMSIF